MSVTFRYKAIDEHGKVHYESMKAEHSLALEKRLNIMGLELISYKESLPRYSFFTQIKISRRELIKFTFQMQQLHKSGVSLLDSLNDLKDSTEDKQMKTILSEVSNNIQGGKTFSQALEEYPHIFNSVYISLINVGEKTGRIAEVMYSMAENLKWQDELMAHTQKIMIYPAIVLVIITGVITYLMIYLVPELIPFIEGLGGTIPLQTQALISTSMFLQEYGYYIFGGVIIVFFGLNILIKRASSVNYFLDTLKLKVYIFGPLILKSHLARFSNYFAMMYASGLNILESLKIAESLMGNAVLTKSIIEIREHICQGEPLSKSFSRHKIYPPLIIRMLKVGETTGALDEALLNVSYFYNREVKESIDRMEAAITPLLTIIMGGVMLWIMSAILSPIYDSLTLIG